MLECDYIVKQIDGDYAHLQRVDQAGGRNSSLWREHYCRLIYMKAVNCIMR